MTDDAKWAGDPPVVIGQGDTAQAWTGGPACEPMRIGPRGNAATHPTPADPHHALRNLRETASQLIRQIDAILAEADNHV